MRKRCAAAPDRRAAALLRWYPAAWRARYGDEFAELLAADLAERPRGWRRTANIVRCGLSARLADAGLTARALDPAAQVRASLATVSCALAAFLALGLAMLAQLAIGWQWASPRGAATRAGTVLMCGAAGAVVMLSVIAAVPFAGRAMAGLIRRRQPAWPAGLLVAGGLFLVAGAHHFQNHWPGTGGMAGHRGLVPGNSRCRPGWPPARPGWRAPRRWPPACSSPVPRAGCLDRARPPPGCSTQVSWTWRDWA